MSISWFCYFIKVILDVTIEGAWVMVHGTVSIIFAIFCDYKYYKIKAKEAGDDIYLSFYSPQMVLSSTSIPPL